MLWHLKEIPGQQVPLNNNRTTRARVHVDNAHLQGMGCGQSEIVVLAFSVFKRTIFIILARNQDPPWDNGAKHNDLSVLSLLHTCTFTQMIIAPSATTHTHMQS